MTFPAISSPANERIKRAARLRRGQHRREDGRTLVDGLREISAAAAAEVKLLEVFFCPDQFESPPNAMLADLTERGTAVFAVSPAVLERLAFGERSAGIVAVAEIPDCSLADLVLPSCPLVAVLERVEKPGNIGAVVRSADAAGVSALIVADPATDLFNPNAIRASLGTIFRLPVCATDSASIAQWLREHQVQMVAARLDAKAAPWEVDLTKPTAIILGAEATGVSPVWSGDDVQGVRLPMLGTADSLNVSAAAAVIFYEALRQRTATQQ
ncbi:MAG: RNA methyltransferase [Planctomycetia bacterium]|nr:RNA methyltransferase [Planctomycetia bacterium]